MYALELENPEVKHYLCTKCRYSNTDEGALQDHMHDFHLGYNEVGKLFLGKL